MTPEREKYLQNISFSERIARRAINECKAEIKRQKKYLNENKKCPLSGGYKPSDSKRMVKKYKQKLKRLRLIWRIGANHEKVLSNQG